MSDRPQSKWDQMRAELSVCLHRGERWTDRLSLVSDTARFHLGNHLGLGSDLGRAQRYRVRVGSRQIGLSLRRQAGDLFVFHEVFAGDFYSVPVEWRASIRSVVDLGAHVGLTALFYLETLPESRVVCVEAAADNVELLRENLKGFADRTLILEGAIAARSGVGTFDRVGWSWGRRLQVDGAVADGVSVRCYTIADVMREAGLDRIDLLKVDVEGTEEDLFENADSWLPAVRFLIIELHERYSLERFSARVQSFGFKVITPDQGRGNRMVMAVARGSW